jgi:hypothetical protein
MAFRLTITYKTMRLFTITLLIIFLAAFSMGCVDNGSDEIVIKKPEQTKYPIATQNDFRPQYPIELIFTPPDDDWKKLSIKLYRDNSLIWKYDVEGTESNTMLGSWEILEQTSSKITYHATIQSNKYDTCYTREDGTEVCEKGTYSAYPSIFIDGTATIEDLEIGYWYCI